MSEEERTRMCALAAELGWRTEGESMEEVLRVIGRELSLGPAASWLKQYEHCVAKGAFEFLTIACRSCSTPFYVRTNSAIQLNRLLHGPTANDPYEIGRLGRTLYGNPYS